jgi:hypothetical protein
MGVASDENTDARSLLRGAASRGQMGYEGGLKVGREPKKKKRKKKEKKGKITKNYKKKIKRNEKKKLQKDGGIEGGVQNIVLALRLYLTFFE